MVGNHRVVRGVSWTWLEPYYIDVGTGQTDLTWQAIAGLGYAFKSADS